MIASPSVLIRIASGDAAAVRECIDQYGALVWSLARRLSRTQADAEDATQEIFTHIWRYAARFDESKGSEKVFIAMIARRRLIDRLRQSRKDLPTTSSVDIIDTTSWSDPGLEPDVSLEANLALQVLEQLRPEQREVLELGLIHGLSHAEIAVRLDMPLGTVKSTMRRGIMRLREVLGRGSERSDG
jgi:RNA polymerase sigma-70 factor (ECF subfamily)